MRNWILGVLVAANYAMVCGALPAAMPSGTISVAPVQTIPFAVTAIAQPAIYPALIRVIAPRNSKYGLFEFGDNTKLIYGPADLDPESSL